MRKPLTAETSRILANCFSKLACITHDKSNASMSKDHFSPQFLHKNGGVVGLLTKICSEEGTEITRQTYLTMLDDTRYDLKEVKKIIQESHDEIRVIDGDVATERILERLLQGEVLNGGLSKKIQWTIDHPKDDEVNSVIFLINDLIIGFNNDLADLRLLL